MLAVKSGSGMVEIEGQQYELAGGDVAFIDCSKPYSHRTGDDLWTVYWAHFDGPALLAIYNKFIDRSGKPVFATQDITQYIDLLHALYEIGAGASYVRDMSINTMLSSLLEKVMRDCWNEGKSTGNTKVEKIRLYMENHYMESITLESMSKEFFMEKTYLAHVFSRATGTSPIKYLSVVRIRKVKELLRFTNDTLAEIAKQTGFSTEQYLSRVFKDMEGIPPREYRKRWK
ncbi:Helix-turn-helix, AraC type:Arac protein, arabinose-binding/dimerization [Anaerovibrio sp. JC8]|nr:Helix-turn-helix, AraC type:Arac protein, arabinose-binding/dimerization [Anaerovibrio sp. JC8]